MGPWHGVQIPRESKVSRVVIFSLRDDRNSRVILTQAPYLTLVQRKRPVQRLTGSSVVEPGVGGRSHSTRALSQATDTQVVIQLPSHQPGPGHQCVFLLINCTNLHWSSDSHSYPPRACCLMQSMGSQRAGHDLGTEQQQPATIYLKIIVLFLFQTSLQCYRIACQHVDIHRLLLISNP